MYQTWQTPEITYSRLYADMLNQHHVLIAGATGSGKSVVINGIIHAALKDSPARVGFILIDPKRVELAPYAALPHTITHAKGFNPKAWTAALTQAVNIMDARYAEMERKHQKMYNGSDIYVIIDEWANVYKNGGAACYKAVMRLTSEGRAAKVHVIMATQVPKANVIPTEIRENFTARLCLRCNTKAESRVLMDVAGCEKLPQYGQGYYITPRGKDLYKLPMIEETKLQKVIDHWMTTRPRRHLFKPAV
jgi:S-DNA-T family DNA segregation ATPase FtsK/SpoIIIE